MSISSILQGFLTFLPVAIDSEVDVAAFESTVLESQSGGISVSAAIAAVLANAQTIFKTALSRAAGVALFTQLQHAFAAHAA